MTHFVCYEDFEFSTSEPLAVYTDLTKAMHHWPHVTEFRHEARAAGSKWRGKEMLSGWGTAVILQVDTPNI